MEKKNWRYWFKLLFFICAIAVAGMALIVAGLSYKQAQAYMHPARIRASGELLKTKRISYRDIELTTEDGVKLSAWYVPPRNGAVILLAHGHASRRLEDICALLASRGYGAVAWDFRAHGKSGGDFTSLGYYETLDVKAALDFALSQPGVKHMGALGISMGGATVLRAAARYPQIEALVTDSAFSALRDQLNRTVPYPVINPLIRSFAEWETGLSIDLVRPADDIRRISPRPVLIIQSSNDKTVPLDSALRFYENAGEPKELWIVDQAHHALVYETYPGEYAVKISAFFDAYLLK